MARVCKQFLRMFFAMEACGMLYVLFVGHSLLHPRDARLAPWLYLIGVVAFALYAAAFWTTRKPLLHRNAPAIVACVLNLSFACVFLFHAWPANQSTLVVNIALAIVSIAGLFIFFRREKPVASTLAPAKLAEIPGDRTWRGTAPIVTLLFVVAAFVLERSWRQWAAGHGLVRPAMPLMLLAIALSLTVTAIIHESGHALAGALFGMRLLSITIGPFRWARRDGQWRFKPSRQIFGGSVSSAPTHLSQPAWQDALMVFAGPLANLCSAPVLFVLALGSPATRFGHLWFFLSFAASLSLIVPVLNLVPFRTATGSYSDGARLVQLFTASPVLEYQRALRALKSTLVTPQRARDLDAAVFQRAAALRPVEYLGMHAHVCAAQVLEDQTRISEAAKEIAAAQAIDRSYAIQTPALLYCVFVYFEAVHNRDAAAAQLWWDRMTARHPDNSVVDYLTAAAALAWIESVPKLPNAPQPLHRHTSAESAWLVAHTASQKLPTAGAYNATRERIALLRTLLDQSARSKETTQVVTAMETWPS